MQSEVRNEVVFENISIANDIYKLTIKGNFNGEPGQFYMLRAWDDEPLLGRPISINYINQEEISFIYQVKGRGTEILKKLKKGDSIKLMGPSGNGFKLDELKGKIAIVAGGLGIAPLLYAALNAKNVEMDLYAGFKDETYVVDDFKGVADKIYISTESGSVGHKGYVTDIFNPRLYSEVLCCGPEPMMKKVIEMCKNEGVPIQVSIEKRMGCGMGACLVCTCKTVKGNARTCLDGPVFNGFDIVF